MGALEETKWFGSEVYMVGESVVLTAGRDVPGIGHVKQRGEEVAIVLTGPAIGAWKAGGKCWKAWNSRIISAILISGSRSQTVFMCSLAMFQHMHPAGKRKRHSLIACSKLYPFFHLVRAV